MHTVFALLCFVVVIHWLIFPISIRLTSLALWQSSDCPSVSKASLMNMDKYFMWIHYERLHNHNKAKHNKTVCIFLGIYCIVSISKTETHALEYLHFIWQIVHRAGYFINRILFPTVVITFIVCICLYLFFIISIIRWDFFSKLWYDPRQSISRLHVPLYQAFTSRVSESHLSVKLLLMISTRTVTQLCNKIYVAIIINQFQDWNKRVQDFSSDMIQWSKISHACTVYFAVGVSVCFDRRPTMGIICLWYNASLTCWPLWDLC